MKHKDALKNEAFEEFLLEEDQALLPQEYLEKEENRRRIVGFIDELPDSYRECVVLHYYQNLTYAQIAQVLEVSFDTVNNNMRMARLYLKRKMETDAAAHKAPAGQVTMFAMGAVLSGSLLQTAAATASAAAAKQCLALAGVYTAFAGGGLLAGALSTAAGKVAAGVLAASVLAAGGGVALHVANGSSAPAAAVSQPVGPPQSPQAVAPGAGHEDTPASVVQNVLSGRVYMKPGGEADPSAFTGLGDIRVELLDAADPDRVLAETTTQGGAANGGFQLAGMADGEYLLRVWLPEDARLISGGEELLQSKTGRATGAREVMVVKEGETLLSLTGNATSIGELDIQVDIPAKVSGRIQLYLNKADIPYDHEMLPGVAMLLLDPQGRQVGRTDIYTDGSFAFDQPLVSQKGAYTLRVYNDESSPVALAIPDVEIELEPGYGT